MLLLTLAAGAHAATSKRALPVKNANRKDIPERVPPVITVLPGYSLPMVKDLVDRIRKSRESVANLDSLVLEVAASSAARDPLRVTAARTPATTTTTTTTTTTMSPPMASPSAPCDLLAS